MCGNLFRKPPTPHTPTVPAATSICICVTTSLVLVWHPVQPILYKKQLASRCLCILRLLLLVCMWPEIDVRDQKNYGHTVLRGEKRALLAGKCRPAVCPHTYKCWPHNMLANNTEPTDLPTDPAHATLHKHMSVQRALNSRDAYVVY